MINNIRLTQGIKKGGCAAKLPAGSLTKLIKTLAINSLPELIIGAQTLEDSCVWDLGQNKYLIQSLDFFTPIVDNPYDFGAIAAANSLSDIYAMGADPKTALTILAFPSSSLDLKILEPLMSGALDIIHQAQACLAGGHTIDDETLKLGFSVSGFVDKKNLWLNSGARPGDKLILTKPLGTGVITSALKQNIACEKSEQEVISSMKKLNYLGHKKHNLDIHAATDITGFGLVGHALNIARESKVTLKINMNLVPDIFGARELLAQEVRNRAHFSNHDYAQNQKVKFNLEKNNPDYWLACDPQTSGGLLLCMPEAKTYKNLDYIKKLFPHACIIGEVQNLNLAPVVIN